MTKENWIWMGHTLHYNKAMKCHFHLTTYVNGYIVATYGQYLPSEPDLKDLIKNKIAQGVNKVDKIKVESLLSLKGDSLYLTYIYLFDFEPVHGESTFCTQIYKGYKAHKKDCCSYEYSGNYLYCEGYDDARKATDGHMRACLMAEKVKLDEKTGELIFEV